MDSQKRSQIRHCARHGPRPGPLARRRDTGDDPKGRGHVQGEGQLGWLLLRWLHILLRFYKNPAVCPISTRWNKMENINVFALKSYIFAMRRVHYDLLAILFNYRRWSRSRYLIVSFISCFVSSMSELWDCASFQRYSLSVRCLLWCGFLLTRGKVGILSSHSSFVVTVCIPPPMRNSSNQSICL